MTTRGQDIASVLKRQIEEFGGETTLTEVGTVVEVGDGIARIHGLSKVGFGEPVSFPSGVAGLALNLEEDSVGAAIMGPDIDVKEGDEVKATGDVARVPVGDALLGRVVDPLGQPVDGKGPIRADGTRPIELVAPNVVARQAVNTPVQTGVKAIDCMIPIGRGQRELVLGDRQTGKTAICLDAIINQKGQDVTCIYVAIGQKASTVANVIDTLTKHGAMEYTTVVSATANDPAPLQFLAPYSGTAIGEEVRDNGGHAFVIYDDLTKHAWAYRQMSLLLRRPPGREAYPGDVFNVHSKLLERACKLNDSLGGGSLTSIPIIETQLGDVSAYIPTNVISITDGQIYLEPDLFNAGVRPAINVGISVSRVGGNAQEKATKKVAGKLRLDLAQYRELAAFAQFASDLDKSTRDQLTRGERLVELLKQDQFVPMPFEQQVMAVYCGTSGALDDLPTEKIKEFEKQFLEFMAKSHPAVAENIRQSKKFEKETEESLKKAIEEFKAQFAGAKKD